MPSRVPDGGTRGHIVPIGGAENKENDPRILARVVEASGGGDADVVVIPTASRAGRPVGRPFSVSVSSVPRPKISSA